MSPSLLAALSAFGCAPYPEGLLATPEGSGPLVTIDWDARPLPEIPFPNDLATRPDSGSVTGLRLNISEEAETPHQEDDRRKLNELTGFGIYSAIAVGFEAPLDLDNIAARHRDDPALGAAQFPDDAFYVINVDPDSPQYLAPVELDVGHGRFPADTWDSGRYLPNDTRAEHPSVVFDTVDEDKDGDGVLDWGEDTDNDGVLDVANVYPVGGDPWEDLLTWYERNTNTLIARPVVPLAEETTYAVVLTTRLLGEGGEPVRSPWEYVHHLRQTDALYPLWDAMPELGLSMEHVAFAWTFTTGRITTDLVDIRRGLDGEGPFASRRVHHRRHRRPRHARRRRSGEPAGAAIPAPAGRAGRPGGGGRG